jgi:hypothetical protein
MTRFSTDGNGLDAQSKNDGYALPMIYGGISHQPAGTRFLNQVASADNMDFLVWNGMNKRSAFQVNRAIDNSTLALASGNDYRLHAIRRSATEEYVVVYGVNGANMRIRPFEDYGVEGTVTFGTGVMTYLTANGATADDLRFCTIADGTIIVNTLVDTGLLPYDTYTVTRSYKDADVMMSNTPTVVLPAIEYYRAKADGEELDAGYYKYTPGVGTFPTLETTPDAWTDWINVTGGDWNSNASDPKAFRVFFQRQTIAQTNCTVTASGSNWNINKTGAFTNYTPVAGEHLSIGNVDVAVTYPTAVRLGAVKVVSKTDNDNIVVTSASGTDFTAGLSVTLAACTDLQLYGVGAEYDIAIRFAPEYAAGNILDMDDIAARIQQEFRNLNEDGVTVAWVPTTGGAGKFRIGGPLNGRGVSAGDNTIHRPLPPINYEGDPGDLTVAGRPFSRDSGDYSITAATGGTVAAVRVDVVDRWTRVPGPGEADYKPDPDKMPVLMTRDVYYGDHTTASEFSINQIAWNMRESGDDETNPAPDLLTSEAKITDVKFAHDRVWFSGDDKLLGTAAGDFWRVYKDQDTQTSPSDPIEKQAAGNSVAKIVRLKPINDVIVATTNVGQVYEARGGQDGTWEPTTVSLLPRASIEVIDVEPAEMDGRVYFPTREHSPVNTTISAGMTEWSYDDRIGGNAPSPISEHVKRLFSAYVTRVLAVPVEGVLVVLTSTNQDKMYVWRTYYNDAGQRVQSAWTKYSYDSAETIHDVCLLTSGMFVLVYTDDNEWLLERCRFFDDWGSLEIAGGFTQAWSRRMDRVCIATGVYDGSTYTNYTLTDEFGTTFDDSTIDTVVIDGTGVVLTLARPSTSTARVTGNYAGSALLGRKFTASARLSEQMVRYGNGLAQPGQTMNVSAMTIQTLRTGSYTVTLDRPAALGDVTQTFTSTLATTPDDSRTDRFYGIGFTNDVGITISSDGVLPVNVCYVGFEGDVVRSTL